MGDSKLKKACWDDLPKGFHHRRLGTKSVGFEVYIWKGEPGQVVLANAGTHGDEYEGPKFLISMVNSWRPRKLRGTVVVIPVLNEAAFIADAKLSPNCSNELLIFTKTSFGESLLNKEDEITGIKSISIPISFFKIFECLINTFNK